MVTMPANLHTTASQGMVRRLSGRSVQMGPVCISPAIPGMVFPGERPMPGVIFPGPGEAMPCPEGIWQDAAGVISGRSWEVDLPAMDTGAGRCPMARGVASVQPGRSAGLIQPVAYRQGILDG